MMSESRIRWASFVRMDKELAAQDFNECSAEFDVEGGVDDWIESTVDVAQPGKGAIELRWNTT